jgi:hypothetical protein
MFFGMASYLLEKAEVSRFDARKTEFFNSLDQQITLNPHEFIEVFKSLFNFDVQSFWGWNTWDMRPEDGVTFPPKTDPKIC